ncbi:MAG TPA: MOSC domain-containing protein, partial [Streptosporangiaceae bacterium]|nr:MOSC domain-containing protein [Streptosporangiaceae bacterium]
DHRFHGGDDQAVYAYSREELDLWAKELGRELPNGVFGENLTTLGLDTTDALIGERWQIGGQVVLEVCATRIPCRTFAGWVEQDSWMKRFTQRALPGAYLRVITPGEIGAGDGITVLSRPDHGVTSGVVFRALTLEPDLLPRLLDVEALAAHQRDNARRRVR